MAFSLPFLKKKQEKQVYFGLYFTESRICGFAFDVIDGIANILSHSAYDVASGTDKMIEDIDNLISDLELKTGLSLNKTIFFLHSTMLDEANRDIKEPYKEMLKKFSKELELEPMGYIDVHEAVEGNLKENSVINSVVLELSTNQLSVFVYKGGVLNASKVVSRTDNVAADVNSAVETFPKNIILPTKITMYGVGDLSKVSTDIAAFKWDTKVFAQNPSIDILKEVSLYQVLANTFSEELSAHGKPAVQQKTPVPAVPSSSTSTPEPTPTPSENSTFGFVMNEDVRGNGPASSMASAVVAPATPTARPESQSNVSKAAFDPSGASSNQRTSLRMPSFSFGGEHIKVIAISVLIVGILVGSFFGYEYFIHKATIEVTVATADLSKELEMKLPVVETSSPKELSVIAHTKVTEYDSQKDTTGKRDVGEKAKGDVMIHNFDNSEKTIERGTELTYKGLKFVLDSDVKVASSSGISSDGVKQSGKAKATVTAADIGDDYNISKSSQLTIASLSDSLFIAIADSTFTGGSKKQVTTVSKSDIEALKKAAEEAVKKKSQTDLASAVAKDEELIEDLTVVKLAETKFSGEVGEEAKNVKITASAEVEYFTIEKSQLQTAILAALDKEKKEKYSVNAKDTVVKIKDVELNKAGDEATMTVLATADQYKKIDEKEARKLLTFASVDSVQAKLQKKYDVEKAVVQSNPPIPFLSSWLPYYSQNITIKIITQ